MQRPRRSGPAGACACFAGFGGGACERAVAVDFRQVATVALALGVRGLRPKVTPLVRLFASTPLAARFAFTLGRLEYDGAFDLRAPATQKYVLEMCANATDDKRLRVVPGRATCFLQDFDDWLRDGEGLALPMSDAARFTDRLAAFLAAKEDAYDDVVGFDCATREVRWLVVTSSPTSAAAEPRDLRTTRRGSATRALGARAPPGVGAVLRVSDLWVVTFVLRLILESTPSRARSRSARRSSRCASSRARRGSRCSRR